MRSLLALLLLPLLAPLSGCLQCAPTLDVRHCAEPVAGCAPREGDRTVAWTGDATALWPDVPRLMAKAHNGRHQHAEWTQNEADAFWSFWQVPADQEEKQLFFTEDGATYRIRILAC